MKFKIKNIYFLFSFFFILYIIYYWIEFDEDAMQAINDRTIENDGYCILYDPKYIDILDHSNSVSLDFLKKNVLLELLKK